MLPSKATRAAGAIRPSSSQIAAAPSERAARPVGGDRRRLSSYGRRFRNNEDATLPSHTSTREAGRGVPQGESLPGVLLIPHRGEGNSVGCLGRSTRVHFFPGSMAPVSVDLCPAAIAPCSVPLSSLCGCAIAHDHFFSISRSSCRMRFSLRSRASSSRSAVVNAPGLPLPRSTRVCSTHLRNDDSVKSRSRAAAPTVFPSSSTSRTAPALNSSLKLRRVRLGCLSVIVDIVSLSWKVSTKPDQAHHGVRGRGLITLANVAIAIRGAAQHADLTGSGAVPPPAPRALENLGPLVLGDHALKLHEKLIFGGGTLWRLEKPCFDTLTSEFFDQQDLVSILAAQTIGCVDEHGLDLPFGGEVAHALKTRPLQRRSTIAVVFENPRRRHFQIERLRQLDQRRRLAADRVCLALLLRGAPSVNRGHPHVPVPLPVPRTSGLGPAPEVRRRGRACSPV